MNWRALSLALGMVAAMAASATAAAREEGGNPMRYVGAYAAVDSVIVVENSQETPFILRFAGADPRHISTEQNQLWIPIGEMMHQLILTTVEEVMPGTKKQPEDRAVLTAHAEWECKDHNEMLNEHQTVKPAFEQIASRTWCHWTYDLSVLREGEKEKPKETAEGHPAKTQHVFSTVIGNKIVVLIGNTLTGDPEENTLDALRKVARTFVALPKPLTPEKIKELCSQKPP